MAEVNNEPLSPAAVSATRALINALLDVADEPHVEEKTYKIVRHRFNENNEVVRTGLTLEEAQAHCNDESTHGDGWFDGYAEE